MQAMTSEHHFLTKNLVRADAWSLPSCSRIYIHLLSWHFVNNWTFPDDFKELISCFKMGQKCSEENVILGRDYADSMLECMEYCMYFPSGKCQHFNYYIRPKVCLALKGCKEISINHGDNLFNLTLINLINLFVYFLLFYSFLLLFFYFFYFYFIFLLFFIIFYFNLFYLLLM